MKNALETIEENLVLVRHGETSWNVEGRLQGREDVPLNRRGRNQAERAAEVIASSGVNSIWASPLARARETASIIARRLGLVVEVASDLTEMDHGIWQGVRLPDIERCSPAEFETWTGAPERLRVRGAETYDDVEGRIRALLRRLPPGRVCLVTHGVVIQAAARIAGISRRLSLPANGSLLELARAQCERAAPPT